MKDLEIIDTGIEPDFVQFAEADDIWVRAYSLKEAGQIVPQHAHEHEHITLLCRGSIRGWKDGELLGDFNAPALIVIPAGSKHAFLALTNDVVLSCLHNLRGTDTTEPRIMEEHKLI